MTMASLVVGYRGAFVFMALETTGMRTKLLSGCGTAGELASSLGLNQTVVEALLLAGAGVGILRADAGRYEFNEQLYTTNSAEHDRHFHHIVEYHRDYARWWLDLADLARSSCQAIPPPAQQSFSDVDKYRTFIRGVHAGHAVGSRRFAEIVSMEQTGTLLDCGCGAGSYSLALLQKYPDLKCVLLDLPTVIEVTKEFVAEEEMTQRVEFIAGDHHIADLRGPYDTMLFSNVLHLENRGNCQRLLERAVRALRPNGRILINEPLLDDDGLPNPENMTFNINVVLRSGLEGRLFSSSELFSAVRNIGAQEIFTHRIGAEFDLYGRPYTVLDARM